jgi:hypothetical protein
MHPGWQSLVFLAVMQDRSSGNSLAISNFDADYRGSSAPRFRQPTIFAAQGRDCA